MSSAISADSLRAAGTSIRPDRRRGKRDVWIVFWIVPAFYTAFGVIFSRWPG